MQSDLASGQRAVAARALPGMQPVGGPDWITVDGMYGPQLAEKARLMRADRAAVLQVLPEGQAAAAELVEIVLERLAVRSDFRVTQAQVIRPDGVAVALRRDDPLGTLSQVLQEDLCLLVKAGSEHVLVAALLCFPAGWTLAEKIGRPLLRIHEPVARYTPDVAARVQRLFDGVQVGRPIWRANLLNYDDPALFQPHPEAAMHRPGGPDSWFERSERQTLVRLPRTEAVLFAIHTSVVARRL